MLDERDAELEEQRCEIARQTAEVRRLGKKLNEAYADKAGKMMDVAMDAQLSAMGQEAAASAELVATIKAEREALSRELLHADAQLAASEGEREREVRRRSGWFPGD